MSSEAAAVDDREVATAMQLIRDHACEGMSVHDVDLVVKKLIRRSCGGELATEQLRERIVLQITQLSQVGSAATVDHVRLELGR